MQFDREQTISIMALVVLLLLCVCAVQLSVQARFDAAQELDERQDMIARLEATSRTAGAGRPAGAAPAAAFLDAPTQGLAAAQLEAYLARLAGAQQVALISSGLESAKREDTPDTIRQQATMELGLNALQTILHRIESGTPYVFVDALTVQLAGAARGRPSEDPLLRASLSVRAFWRRGAS